GCLLGAGWDDQERVRQLSRGHAGAAEHTRDLRNGWDVLPHEPRRHQRGPGERQSEGPGWHRNAATLEGRRQLVRRDLVENALGWATPTAPCRISRTDPSRRPIAPRQSVILAACRLS